jgi:hypothetical protein
MLQLLIRADGHFVIKDRGRSPGQLFFEKSLKGLPRELLVG